MPAAGTRKCARCGEWCTWREGRQLPAWVCPGCASVWLPADGRRYAPPGSPARTGPRRRGRFTGRDPG
jgi:hypothetical protein